MGAGLVVDGNIYHGCGYGAGEIGHWTMWTVEKGDRRRPVSLEALISEREIVDRARAFRAEMVQGAPHPLQAVFFAVRNGHRMLHALLDEVAYYTGIALANLVDVLNPQLVLLGGLLHEGYDLLSEPITATMRQFAFGGLGNQVEIRPATFGRAVWRDWRGRIGLGQVFLYQQPIINSRGGTMKQHPCNRLE